MARTSTRTTRIELRADPDRRATIQRAAAARGQTLSAFVLEAAGARADEVLAAERGTVVSAEYFDALWAALDEPEAPNQRLREAAERADERVRHI